MDILLSRAAFICILLRKEEMVYNSCDRRPDANVHPQEIIFVDQEQVVSCCEPDTPAESDIPKPKTCFFSVSAVIVQRITLLASTIAISYVQRVVLP